MIRNLFWGMCRPQMGPETEQAAEYISLEFKEDLSWTEKIWSPQCICVFKIVRLIEITTGIDTEKGSKDLADIQKILILSAPQQV